MAGRPTISSDVLARYAADAACDVDGVRGLVASQLHRHRGVRISMEDDQLSLEIHLDVDWGASLPALGRSVQRRVADYLDRMAGTGPAKVDVVIEAIGPAR